MPEFDPRTRRETWLFLKIANPDNKSKPVYRRLRFNLVSYDGSPDQFIEPIPMSEAYNMIDPTSINIHQLSATNGLGRVERMEFFDTMPFDGVHGFD